MKETRFKQAPARELVSANDAAIELGQNALTENFDPHLLQADAVNAPHGQSPHAHEGLLGTLTVEHPLVISYLFSWRHDNRMIYVSSAIASLGFAQQLWLDEADFRLKQVHEDDFERVYMALQHSIGTGEKFNCHYRLYDSRGNVRWFHDEASVKFDGSGAPMFLKGIMLDITDKKSMESELHEHRYYIERKVEQRTELLKRQMALLESCNAALCKKLESVQAVPPLQKTAQDDFQVDHALQLASGLDESIDGISDWVRNTFGCRVAAAGAIA